MPSRRPELRSYASPALAVGQNQGMDLTSDTSRGAWIRPRLRGWGVVGGVVPHGFEAYARILHPISGMRFDLDESHQDQWGRPPVIDSAEWTWTQVAARTGRTIHPLVQSRNLFERDPEPALDGWRLDHARVGHLDPTRLSYLVDAFRLATTTPHDVTAAVWVGWGSFHDGAVAYLTFSDEVDSTTDQTDRFITAQHDSVSDAVRAAVRNSPNGTLDLPDREYLLFTTTLDELADPTWTQRAGIGGNALTGSPGESPQLLWPADHTWCLATEIDFDSTLVGGSRDLIDRVLATESLETFEVGPDDDLTWKGDSINPAPLLP